MPFVSLVPISRGKRDNIFALYLLLAEVNTSKSAVSAGRVENVCFLLGVVFRVF